MLDQRILRDKVAAIELNDNIKKLLEAKMLEGKEAGAYLEQLEMGFLNLTIINRTTLPDNIKKKVLAKIKQDYAYLQKEFSSESFSR